MNIRLFRFTMKQDTLMKLGTLFNKFHLEKIQLNLKLVDAEISFKPADQDAAWELYIEMLTRIVTTPTFRSRRRADGPRQRLFAFSHDP